MQESHVFWSLDTGTTYTRVTEGGDQIQIPGRPAPTPFRSSVSGNGTWESTFQQQNKTNQPNKTNPSLKTTYQEHNSSIAK